MDAEGLGLVDIGEIKDSVENGDVLVRAPCQNPPCKDD